MQQNCLLYCSLMTLVRYLATIILRNLLYFVTLNYNKYQTDHSNKLAVNVKKCKYILFHNKSKKFQSEDLKVVFNQNEIGKTENPDKITCMDRIFTNNPVVDDRTYKYLGITLDENFTLNFHFDNLCKKLARGLFCLRRAKNFLNTKGLRSLYFALFHSHLLYCSLILNCSTNTNIKRILTLQKKAIRIITIAAYNSHTAALFVNLKILPFDKILYFRKIQFMHGIVYKNEHKTFVNVWKTNLDRNNIQNLRNADNLDTVAPKFEGFKRFPLYDFPRAWNEVGDMKLQHNATTFKIWLKNELFLQLWEQT